jgi:hypothetical protein
VQVPNVGSMKPPRPTPLAATGISTHRAVRYEPAVALRHE